MRVSHHTKQMKAKGILLKAATLLLSVYMLVNMSGVFVFAQELPEIKVTINGEYIDFDVPPTMLQNRTMVPVRAIFEALGASVEWDGVTRTATGKKDGITVNITIDSMVMFKNGTPIQLDVPARIINNRTLIPARAVSEALECKVEWDGSTRTVIITSEKKEMDASGVSALVSPAVFYIENYDKYGHKLSSGSGFFIDEKGTAVTNYHVVSESYSSKITVKDGRIFDVAKTYLLDAQKDIAVIGVDNTDSEGNACEKFDSIKLKTDAPVKDGEKVFAIGSPLGLQNSISEGIVSNAARKINDDGEAYIQTTAPISSGSSGGVLANAFGEAVGITTSSIVSGQNLNLAIPVYDVKDILANPGEGKPFLEASTHEYYERMRSITEPSKSIKLVDYSSGNNAIEVITHADTFGGTFKNASQGDMYMFTLPADAYLDAFAYSNTVNASVKTKAMLEPSTVMLLLPLTFSASGEEQGGDTQQKEDASDTDGSEDISDDLASLVQSVGADESGDDELNDEKDNGTVVSLSFSQYRIDDSGTVVSSLEGIKLEAGSYFINVRCMLPEKSFAGSYNYTVYFMFTPAPDYEPETPDEYKGSYEGTAIPDFGRYYDVDTVGSTPYEKTYSSENFENAEKFDIAIGDYGDYLIENGYRLNNYYVEKDYLVYGFTNKPLKQEDAVEGKQYNEVEMFYHIEENGIEYFTVRDITNGKFLETGTYYTGTNVPNFGVLFGVPELLVQLDYKPDPEKNTIYPVVAYYSKEDFGTKINFEDAAEKYGKELDDAGFLMQGKYRLQDGGEIMYYMSADYSIALVVTSLDGNDIFVVEVMER